VTRKLDNVPPADEVAAGFVGDDGEPRGNVHFIVSLREGRLTRLAYTSPHIDPLVYPLLFPPGQQGWQPHTTNAFVSSARRRPTSSRHSVTMLQFHLSVGCASRLQPAT